jgi:DNA-binding SARP family transcriptional activator
MQPVRIKTLGEYSISYGNNVITEKDKRSKKMWTLLKYLTAFKDRGATQAELIRILWGESDVGNPAGALKTQLHRLRGSLDAALGIEADTELVVSYSGTYAFNNALEYTIDTVDFENCYKNSQRDDISEKEQIGFIKKAFELYQGDFMKNSGGEKWVVPIRVYYHSIYVRVVHRLSDALYKHKQYTELINVCRKAMQIENADQKIHILLIKSLAASGERDAAKRHYKYVIDMLYNQLGVNPTPELRELYMQTIDREGTLENDLEAIKQKLKEDNGETEHGAFFCELEVFKSIYRLKVRDAQRNGQKIQICLITVADPDAGEQNQAPREIVKEMKKLHECVGDSLRKSDIYARYSVSQLVLMLPTATEETVDVVIGRITERYKAASSGFLLEIDFKHIMA